MAFETGEIERVSAMVRSLAGRDVSGLSRDELLDAHEAVAKLGRMVQALGARFAGEVARRSDPMLPGGGLSRQQGNGNANQHVQKVTGATAAGARSQVEAGDAFTPIYEPDENDARTGESADAPEGSSADAPPPRRVKYPFVADAQMVGDLSVDAAGLIVAGLNAVRDHVSAAQLVELEKRLVDKSIGRKVPDVRRLVAAVVAKIDPGGLKERQRRQHQERYLSWKEDHTGAVRISGVLDAVTAAPIRTVLEQMVTASYRRRRDQDPREADTRTVGQMRADAWHELARHALGCTDTERSGVRTTLVVRMSLEDLTRGEGLGRIDGIDTPVAVSELRRLAGDAGLIPQVLGRDGQVLDLGRTVRLFTSAQRIAMVERDGGCAKCHAPPEHCEAHHLRWWDAGGGTDLSNGVMLCTRCHHDVHRQGWGIEIVDDRVSFIPPPSIDPDRRPQPGGLAAVDMDLNELEDDASPPRMPHGMPPELWMPPITPADLALVHHWEAQARALEDAYA